MIVLKWVNWGNQDIPVSLPPLWESFGIYAKQSRCHEVIVINHDFKCFHILDHFFPFYQPNNLKNKIWKNKTKQTNKQKKKTGRALWKSYDVWCLRHGARQTKIFLTLGHFLTFYPTNNLEIKILIKW